MLFCKSFFALTHTHTEKDWGQAVILNAVFSNLHCKFPSSSVRLSSIGCGGLLVVTADIMI